MPTTSHGIVNRSMPLPSQGLSVGQPGYFSPAGPSQIPGWGNWPGNGPGPRGRDGRPFDPEGNTPWTPGDSFDPAGFGDLPPNSGGRGGGSGGGGGNSSGGSNSGGSGGGGGGSRNYPQPPPNPSRSGGGGGGSQVSGPDTGARYRVAGSGGWTPVNANEMFGYRGWGYEPFPWPGSGGQGGTWTGSFGGNTPQPPQNFPPGQSWGNTGRGYPQPPQNPNPIQRPQPPMNPNMGSLRAFLPSVGMR